MIINEFEFLIGSPSDREDLICEIYYKGELLAEISNEKNKLAIEIYAPQASEWWTIPFFEFENALKIGKDFLLKNKCDK